MKRWIIAGWVTLFVIAVAWVLVIRFTSVQWDTENLPRIAEGQSWDTPLAQATLKEMVILDEAPSSWGDDPITPVEGATFVLVTVEISNREEKLRCTMSLMGEGQVWYTAVALASNIDESYLSSCPSEDDNVPLAQTITLGRLFEVPISMLDNVEGAYLTLSLPSEGSDLLDFTRPYDEAILKGTLTGR